MGWPPEFVRMRPGAAYWMSCAGVDHADEVAAGVLANAGHVAEAVVIGLGRGPASMLAALDDEESRALRTGLEGARLKQERRALRLRPALPQHQWLAADVLELSFALPPGCYATAMLHGLGPVEDASQA